MSNVLSIGKAHQRIIRESKQNAYDFGLMGEPNMDISNARCRPITYQQAKSIILDYEWLGTMGTTQRHYGIFYDGWLAGVVCFGFFQAMQGYSSFVGDKYAKQGIQLSRGACVSWAHPHSGSKLIAYGLNEEKNLGIKYAIAFSDPDAGEVGTLYQATNWYFIGTGNTIHLDIYYKNGKVFLNSRDTYGELGMCGRKNLEDFIKDKPYLEIREAKPKARYIKLLGNHKENKEMMSVLKDKILPYPKRDPNAEEVSRVICANTIGEGEVQFLNSAPLSDECSLNEFFN